MVAFGASWLSIIPENQICVCVLTHCILHRIPRKLLFFDKRPICLTHNAQRKNFSHRSIAQSTDGRIITICASFNFVILQLNHLGFGELFCSSFGAGYETQIRKYQRDEDTHPIFPNHYDLFSYYDPSLTARSILRARLYNAAIAGAFKKYTLQQPVVIHGTLPQINPRVLTALEANNILARARSVRSC